MARQTTLTQKMLAEGLGTFLLTFIGAGSVVATGGSNLLVIALANGLALALAVTIAMGISGGHINPAVTLGMLATRRISGSGAVAYIFAQVLGALVAGAFLLALYPAGSGSVVHYGTPSLAPGITVLQGIAFEAVLTFVLVLTVFGTAVDPRAPKIGGLAIGLAVVIDALAGGPFTGAAMNPARAIGPVVASLYFTNWYVYWIGPIIGGVAAALIYDRLLLKK